MFVQSWHDVRSVNARVDPVKKPITKTMQSHITSPLQVLATTPSHTLASWTSGIESAGVQTPHTDTVVPQAFSELGRPPPPLAARPLNNGTTAAQIKHTQ